MIKHLKRFVAVCLVVLMAVAYVPVADIDGIFGIEASALTTSGSVGNMKWKYDTGNNTLTITGSGSMTNHGSTPEAFTKYNAIAVGKLMNKTKKIVISNGITSIGNNTFSGFGSVTSVSIPASVTSVGEGAFKNCSALSSVSSLSSVTSIGKSAFEGCSSLSGVTLSNNLKTIGDYAFKNTKFASVSLPYTVTSVGANAFAGVSGLKFTCAYGDAAYNYAKKHSSAYTLKAPTLTVDAALDLVNKQVVVTLKLNNAAGLNAANFELTYSNGAVPVSTDTSCGDMEDAINTAVVYNGNGKVSVAVVAADAIPFVAGTQTITYEIAKLTFKANESADTADFNFSAKVLMLDNARYNVSAVKKSLDLHAYTEDTSKAVAPTCVSKGSKTLVCSICSKEKVEEVAVNGANHTGNTEIRNAAEATCAAAGYTGDKVCTDCGATVEKGSEIAKLAHTHTVAETVPADCTKDGYVKYVCSCGDTYTETLKGGEHSYVAQVVAPDCTNSGYTMYTCSACEAAYRGDNVESLGHDYDDKGVCSRCGDVNVKEITFVEDSKMTVDNNTDIIVSKTAQIKYADFKSMIAGDGWVVTDKLGAPLADDKLITTGCTVSHTSGSASYTYVAFGDVNSDGKVTAADARLVLRAAAALETLTETQILAADVDGNKKVVAADARRILRVSSKIDEFK